MKTLLKTVLILTLPAVLALPALAVPEEKPAGDFKDDKEKASYGIGVYFGNQIKSGNMEVDLDTIVSAMKDFVAGNPTKLTPAQASEAIRNYQRQQMTKALEKNKKEGDEFLAANKNKPGVKTKEVTLPDGKTAELQYKVIKEGNGETPKSSDIV